MHHCIVWDVFVSQKQKAIRLTGQCGLISLHDLTMIWGRLNADEV